MSYYVHESSFIDDDVIIGEDTKIWYFCHVQSGARIGKNCSMGQNVNVANNVTSGDNCRIQNNVSTQELHWKTLFSVDRHVYLQMTLHREPPFRKDMRITEKLLWERAQALEQTLRLFADIISGNTLW